MSQNIAAIQNPVFYTQKKSLQDIDLGVCYSLEEKFCVLCGSAPEWWLKPRMSHSWHFCEGVREIAIMSAPL